MSTKTRKPQRWTPSTAHHQTVTEPKLSSPGEVRRMLATSSSNATSCLGCMDVGVGMAEPAKLVSAISNTDPGSPGLVWAFRLHSDGSAEALPIDQPIEFSHDGRLWLHFNLTDARVRPWIAASSLPPLARELLLSKGAFQQLHVIDHCVYGVFSDLVRDIDRATDEIAFLRFAMTEHLLVSARHQSLCSADATRRVLE